MVRPKPLLLYVVQLLKVSQQVIPSDPFFSHQGAYIYICTYLPVSSHFPLAVPSRRRRVRCYHTPHFSKGFVCLVGCLTWAFVSRSPTPWILHKKFYKQWRVRSYIYFFAAAAGCSTHTKTFRACMRTMVLPLRACFAFHVAIFQSIGLVPTDGRRRAPGVVADRAAASKSASRNDAGRTKRRGGGGTPTLAALMVVRTVCTYICVHTRSQTAVVGGRGAEKLAVLLYYRYMIAATLLKKIDSRFA